MKVLVTGSAGFIGFHVCMALLKEGYEVIGVDNYNSYYSPLIKEMRTAEIRQRYPRFRQIHTDLSFEYGLEPLEKTEIDAVIHLAAQAGVRYSFKNPSQYVRDNIVSTQNLLDFCHRNNIINLLYASSSSVYGDQLAPLVETLPCSNPIHPYAASKRACEMLVQAACSYTNLRAIGMRFFTVYGPWGRPDMALYRFADAVTKGYPVQLYNRGEHWRSFTYISDVVDAILSLLDEVDHVKHTIFNIGNPRSVPLRHYVECLAESLGMNYEVEELPLQKGDVVSMEADISKIRRFIGWQPKVRVEDGVVMFAEWYQEYTNA